LRATAVRKHLGEDVLQLLRLIAGELAVLHLARDQVINLRFHFIGDGRALPGSGRWLRSVESMSSSAALKASWSSALIVPDDTSDSNSFCNDSRGEVNACDARPANDIEVMGFSLQIALALCVPS